MIDSHFMMMTYINSLDIIIIKYMILILKNILKIHL